MTIIANLGKKNIISEWFANFVSVAKLMTNIANLMSTLLR